MDLSGARLEERSASYAVVSGRVEAFDERRAELAGRLALDVGSGQPDSGRRHTLVWRGFWWPVVRLELDGPDAGGRSRWRFVAACVPSEVRHLTAELAGGPFVPQAAGAAVFHGMAPDATVSDKTVPDANVPDDDPPLEVED